MRPLAVSTLLVTLTWLALIDARTACAKTPSPKAATPTWEWILDQSHDESGKNTVYVSPDAVKIVCSQGYQVVAKAPDWQVCVFRPEEKIEWRGPMDLFNGVILRNPFAVPTINRRAIAPLSTVQYQGLKCTRYCPPNESHPIILGADDIAVSKKGAELLCRYFYLHSIPRVPVYRLIMARATSRIGDEKQWLDATVMRDLRDGERVALKTQSARKVPFNANDFEYPQNFKRITNINTVSYSSDRRDQLGTMVDEIGFTTKNLKPNQKKERP
ncbi:MAG: hypothetical protein JSS83_12580 [Cyanobacteria bacterium SZAS LIN-3]|nr:hypothetical protein [Cyanobacteria bacterium SZAS LIN-3]